MIVLGDELWHRIRRSASTSSSYKTAPGGRPARVACSLVPVEEHFDEGERVMAGGRPPLGLGGHPDEELFQKLAGEPARKPSTSGCFQTKNSENRARDWAPESMVLSE